MTSLHIQPSDHTTRYVDPEGALVPSVSQSLLGGSSNAPKFGTLIPNRIFVGGIPSNTTEQELKTFFSSFGQVKDVKIINDRLGVSKGSYGFVTFESQEMAENIIKNESETLIFKDRKLNIGHAIRKQQLFPRPADVPATLFFAGGAIPCGFQNGMTVVPLAGQDYSLLTQPGSPYQSMMLQQANGAVYLSQTANPAAAQYSALQSQLAQPNALAAFQQQQYQASLASNLAAGNLTVGSSGANSTAAVMAAAAAAVAAASQWPNSSSSSNSQSSQMPLSTSQLSHQTAMSGHTSTGLSSFESQPQVAALAAAVAAQQQFAAAWRWPSGQQATSVNQTGGVLASSPVASTSSSVQASTSPTAATTVVSQGGQQQSPVPAALSQSAYVYSPATGAGHELMFIQQTNSPYTPNATSDYSTDNSAHSSGFLEAVEPGNFHCDVSPPNRIPHQSYGALPNYTAPMELTYATIPTVVDAVACSTPAVGPPVLGLSSTQTHLHQQASQTPGLLPMPSGQQLFTLASPQQSLITQHQQHKLFAALPPTVGYGGANQNCQLGTTLYGTPQPIIFDVFGGTVPLTQVKQGQILPDGMSSQQADILGCSVKQVSHNLMNAPNHVVPLASQQNGNRGNSPTKPMSNINGLNRGILDSISSSSTATNHSL